MIGYLRGSVVAVVDNTAVVDVSGVGYETLCSTNTLNDISQTAETALWIYTHVREDAIVLFGFSSQVEKKLFESLIKVNGIGPKMAITILSGATLDQLIDYIENDNVKGLTSLPKVGKKTAEQMILTLKGKLVASDEASSEVSSPDLISALVNLGFKAVEVSDVVKDIDHHLAFEDQLRTALKTLRGGL